MTHSKLVEKCRSLQSHMDSNTSPAVHTSPRVMGWPGDQTDEEPIGEVQWFIHGYFSATEPLPYHSVTSAQLSCWWGNVWRQTSTTTEGIHIRVATFVWIFRKRTKNWRRYRNLTTTNGTESRTWPPFQMISQFLYKPETDRLQVVIHPAATPRSYIVQTPSGQLRRNRSHLNPRPEGSQIDTSENDPHDTPDSDPS